MMDVARSDFPTVYNGLVGRPELFPHLHYPIYRVRHSLVHVHHKCTCAQSLEKCCVDTASPVCAAVFTSYWRWRWRDTQRSASPPSSGKPNLPALMISCTVQGAAGEARPGAVLHPARPRLLRPGQHPQAAASLARNINISILSFCSLENWKN